MCICALRSPPPTTVRDNYRCINHNKSLVDDHPLEIVAGGEVPENPGDELLHLVVPGLTEETDQGIRSPSILDCSTQTIIINKYEIYKVYQIN